MRYGIDLSRYQGAVNWEQLAAARIEGEPVAFVLIRAQVGTTVDPLLQTNLSGAASVGLESSVYHVVHENVAGDVQADAFLALLAAQPKPRLPVILDVERPMYAGNSDAHRRVVESTRIMTLRLQAAGYAVM
ncbi:MAG: hypothetical protein M0R37_11875, partial [Bacteroidales bacterium]|nr:hypothetical protein [Bacteroidales bacterium]